MDNKKAPFRVLFEILLDRGRAHPNMARTVSAYLTGFLKTFAESDYLEGSEKISLIGSES